MSESAEREESGRWKPGSSGSPETKWGPGNPPPKSPGRPRKDAWLAELGDRLDDPRIRKALADRLLKIALKGGERAALAAIGQIQDRVGGPVVKRIDAEVASRSGVLIAPAGTTPDAWVAEAMERNRHATEPGKEPPIE